MISVVADVDALLNALPVGDVTVSSAVLDKSCQICMSLYEVGEQFTTLPCLHQYHPACIQNWLARKTTCPICLTSVAEAIRTANESSASAASAAAGPASGGSDSRVRNLSDPPHGADSEA